METHRAAGSQESVVSFNHSPVTKPPERLSPAAFTHSPRLFLGVCVYFGDSFVFELFELF